MTRQVLSVNSVAAQRAAPYVKCKKGREDAEDVHDVPVQLLLFQAKMKHSTPGPTSSSQQLSCNQPTAKPKYSSTKLKPSNKIQALKPLEATGRRALAPEWFFQNLTSVRESGKSNTTVISQRDHDEQHHFHHRAAYRLDMNDRLGS